jgi:putative iron-dependent peroxidase
VVFDVADQVVGALAEVADVALDQPAFVYRDSRDLTGFIDGTANPFLDHAPEVALVPDGEPGAGGTFALTMRWVHDLAAFHARPLAEQEQVFGRTKSDSIELDAHTKPADAHIARVEIEATDGEELELYRRSAAFGTPTEKGLVFVAFAADLGRCDLMLRRMFGEGDDGLVDRLLTFSTPTTGSFWFCPSLDDLERSVGELPDGPD